MSGEITQEQIDELISEQLERQGAASIRVSDGQVFVFKRETLEKLLAAALENDGLATLFVKATPSA